MRLAFIAAAMMLATGVLRASEGNTGPRLRQALNTCDESTELAVWVFFIDKGETDLAKAAQPDRLVSPRSLARRGKLLPMDALVDETDVPVNEAYVREVASRVVRLRHRSKWFNAVSAIVRPGQVAALAALPGVRQVELMARFKRAPEPLSGDSPVPPQPPATLAKAHTLNYGRSLAQAQMINVPPLHDLGYTGWGVTVAVFDNGFRLLEHQALTPLRIIATYDFVDKKVDVKPINPLSGFGAHGINCLSLLAGNSPGNLIGPAFGADFILIRSENDSSETPIEEDNWVAGIEWADSIGVDVTSTSLGYLDYYDTLYTSWTWEDMDGQTTVISRAAAMAATKGIVVVNSAGNEGGNAAHNTLNAPADADGILAVGSVSPSGARSSFSSVGPTVDGRVKPDVMAQGAGVYYASAYTTSGFESFANGTSFSAPQVAGVAALLLEAHPAATPTLIIDALRETASESAAPNNFTGWGIIDALAALGYLGEADSGNGPTIPSLYELHQNYPNPFNPSTTIAFSLPEASTVAIRIYDLMGQRVRTVYEGNQVLPAGSYGTSSGRPGYRWFGDDESGIRVASGVYFVRIEALGVSGRSTVLTRKMVLLR
jgi:subtilisin family serine protease